MVTSLRARSRWTVATVVATGALIMGCGADHDGADEAAEVSAAGETFCVAFGAVSTDQGPDVDFETASEADLETAFETYAAAFVPKLRALEVAAPTSVRDAALVYTSTYETILETGDDSAFDEHYLAAELTLVEAAIDACATDVLEIVGIDYAFTGVDTTVSPGWVGLRLDNRGAEVHEAVVYRRLPGATEPAAELVHLADDELSSKLEFIGVAFVPTDAHGAVLLDLEEGEYVIACQLPTGMTTVDADADGPPHSTAGMLAEFTVA